MDQMRYGDAVINGSGRLSGGRYEDVKISGSGQIDGDLHAEAVKVSGSAKFRGNVSSRTVKVSGSARFKGNVDTGDAKVSGSGTVDGHLHARTIRVSGSLHGKDAVRAEEIRVSGHLNVGSDVESETFSTSGGFTIRGLLNASRVDVSMSGMCYAREIGGDRIEARLAPMNFFWRFVVRAIHLFGRGSRFGLRSELIEGTDVALEWTASRIVRGQRVHIGAGCDIELVEYTESAYVDPDASVKEVRQIV